MTEDESKIINLLCDWFNRSDAQQHCIEDRLSDINEIMTHLERHVLALRKQVEEIIGGRG